MNIDDIKDLIVTINNTDIEIVEIEKSDIKIMISKKASEKSSAANIQMPVKEQEITVANIDEDETVVTEEDLFIVKSPMVGVYYESSGPEELAYVSPGDIVKEGDTLCIVEAMKIMNEIESEVSGEIVEILVENEDVIEYGQALMKIRR